MALRIPWNKYEVAILIDACDRYYQFGGDKSQIIKLVSKQLRLMAINGKIEIDDIYRNENGISMQFTIMSSLLQNSHCGLNGASKLFIEMADIFTKNKQEFDKILKEAKRMLEPQKKNNEDQFAEWFSSKVSPAQMSELYMMYEKIDAFCQKRGILKQPLLKTTDVSSVKKALQAVEQNKVFRFMNRRDFNKILAAIRHYYTYIKEINEKNVQAQNTTTSVETPAPSQESTKEINNTEVKEEIKKETDETVTENYDVPKEMQIDFNDTVNLAFTKPLTLAYFGEEVSELRSWTDLYVNFIKFLYEDYPDKLPVGQYFHGASRLDFSDENASKDMIAPKKITDDLFVETNLSATNIVGKIKSLLEHCLVDFDNVVITYTKKSESSDNSEPMTAARLVRKADEFDEAEDLEQAYKNYLHAAELGNADGMYNVGLYYLNGWYVDEDEDKAIEWLTKAANAGHSDAANDIGVHYHNAAYLRGKHYKAIKWYKIGAELGNKYSQCNLGWYYEYGLGCDIDLQQAKKYYQLSANQGYEDAIKYLNRLNKKLNTVNAEDELTKFGEWLVEDKKMASSTTRGYMSALKVSAEKAIDLSLASSLFYIETDDDELLRISKALMEDAEFIKLNEEQHNRFSGAINRFLEYRGLAEGTLASGRKIYSEKENDFYEWLIQEKKLAPATARTHKYGISEVNKYVMHNKLLGEPFFDIDDSEVKELFDMLLRDEKFLEFNSNTYNRPRTSMYKYLEFLGCDISFYSSSNKEYSEKENEFYEWLANEKKLSPSTCRTHKGAINEVNKFLVENNLIPSSLFELTESETIETFNLLMENEDFLNRNENNYYRLTASMYKYAEFINIEFNYNSNVFKNYSEKENEFYEWLVNEKNLSPSTCRTHKGAINDVNKFLTENSLINSSLFELTENETSEIFKLLMENETFLELNEKNYNRFTAAMYKYAEFVGAEFDYSSTTAKKYSEKEIEFENWLLNDKELASSTSRNHKWSMNVINEYVLEHNLSEIDIFALPNEELCDLFDRLLSDTQFLKYNKENHNKLRTAIYKYKEFIGVDGFVRKPVAKEQIKPDFDTTPYEKVLSEKFIRGFRIGSGLDMRKFKRFYEELYTTPLELDDEVIERNISICCIQHEDRLYLPETMLSEELREKLFEYIRNSFLEGRNAIYYEALFTEFSEEFLDYYIYNADMLKTYITHYNDGEFYMDRNYISKEAHADVNPFDEVKLLLTNAKVPMDAEVVCQTLTHIPETKVMQILGMNAEFVHNGNSVYFHIDIVQLYDEDLNKISSVIQDGIEEGNFLSGNELIDIIKARYPHIIENNSSLSVMGMRDAIKYHLKNKFSFNGNIISALDSYLSMSDVFGQYAKSRNEFDISELDTLAKEMNCGIYFTPVYENALRVSRTRFVSKNQAQFRISETDKAIDRFCTGDYIPLGYINEFGTFPDAGFQWNTYLLAHYVYSYSENYRFFGGFNKTVSVGAIVKRSMGIDDYDDFLAVALSESGIILNKDNALDYLKEQGYIAKRSCSTIEEILIKANAHRNTKGTD